MLIFIQNFTNIFIQISIYLYYNIHNVYLKFLIYLYDI